MTVCKWCDRKAHARGLCHTHYTIDKRSEASGVCSVRYCQAERKNAGLCGAHYQQDLKEMRFNPIEVEKFWNWVKKELAL